MIKKTVLGLLAAAAIILSLTGCSSKPEDSGTAPELKDAFFAENADSLDRTSKESLISKTITDLTIFDLADVPDPGENFSGVPYWLCLQISDPDDDVTAFESGLGNQDFHSEKLGDGSYFEKVDDLIIIPGCWTTEEVSEGDFTFYFRVSDSKGNKSNIVEVSTHLTKN